MCAGDRSDSRAAAGTAGCHGSCPARAAADRRPRLGALLRRRERVARSAWSNPPPSQADLRRHGVRAMRSQPVCMKPRIADRRAPEPCPTDTAASTRGALADGQRPISPRHVRLHRICMRRQGFFTQTLRSDVDDFAMGVPATGWFGPGVPAWPTAGVLRRLRSRLAALQLDHRLVAGEDPVSDPALACRAAQLTRRRCRDQLAGGLERLLSLTRRRAAFSAAIPFDRRAVEIARPALEQLAIALRSPQPIQPRGVALTRLLLTDPCSAVYAPAYSDHAL